MFMNTKPILCIYNYHILRSTNWNNRIFMHFIGEKNLIAIGSPCVNCKTGFLHWCYRYSCIWFIIKLPQNRSRANTRVAFVVDCSTSEQSLCMNCEIQSTIYTNRNCRNTQISIALQQSIENEKESTWHVALMLFEKTNQQSIIDWKRTICGCAIYMWVTFMCHN